MLALLVGSACRALVVAITVWAGLRVCRARNPHVLMTAWTIVLAASLLMPVLTRFATVLPPLSVVPVARLLPVAAPFAALPESNPVVAATPPSQHQALPGIRTAWQWPSLALLVYAAVAGALLMWLGVGLALTWRIVRAATPVQENWAAGHDVRASHRIRTPATFGSVILLPADHICWPRHKRAAVLAHEAAHVARRDFLIQLAANVNRALFWFSPLSWWLQRTLSDLAEAASDDAAIADLRDRPAYAEILLEVSCEARPLRVGVAMARPATIGSRIERILTETAAPGALSQRGRLILAGTIIPVGLLVAAPLMTTPTPASDPATATPDGQAPHQRILVSSSMLDADIGYYEDMATGSVMTVTRDGDHLLTSRMGRPAVPEYPYAPHDFFLTVSAEQNTFVPDASGAIVRVIHSRNGLATSLDRISAQTARQLRAEYDSRMAEELKPHIPVAVDPAVLELYAGTYQLSHTYLLTVIRSGDHLLVQGTDTKAFPVFPYTDRDFFYTAAAAQLSFVAAGPAEATALVLHQDGRDRIATRVSADVARSLQQNLDEERKPHAPVAIAPQQLDRYAGRYGDGTVTMAIAHDSDHLVAQVMGYSKYLVYSYTGRDFFGTTFPVQISFVTDAGGKVVQMVRHEHGQDLALNRLD